MSAAPIDRSAELALRRARLRAQCELQRKHLAEQAAQIEHDLSRIDDSVAIARSFVSKPALIAVGVAALTLIGPGRVLRWIARGTLWYGVAKRMLGTVGALRGAHMDRTEVTVDS